jgi:hypothetical protein
MGQAPLGHPPCGSWIDTAQISEILVFNRRLCSLLTPVSATKAMGYVGYLPMHAIIGTKQVLYLDAYGDPFSFGSKLGFYA